MSLPLLFVTSFIVGLTGAMMPGPLLTVTVAESARHKFRVGPLLILGHGILETILIIALWAGLSTLLIRTGVTMAIAGIGGAVLIWMGSAIVRDVLQGRVELAVAEDPGLELEPVIESKTKSGTGRLPARSGNAPRLVGLGIIISLLNPYFILWWVTVGLGYITLSLEQGIAGLAAFFAGHILSDLAWYSLVAGVVAGSSRFLTPTIYRAILAVCGSFLVLLGGYFIYSGLVKVLWLG